MRIVLSALWLLFAASFASAETRFGLRNTDPSQLFSWWSVPYTASAGAALGSLAASSGRHLVAPGERVEVRLGEGEALLGVFVPWRTNPTLSTPLSGGWVLAREAPTSGTVLVDAPTFAASNRGRSFTATLQEWGQEVPRMVLDGASTDWAKIAPVREWGPRFRASQNGLPDSIPLPLSLQVLEREGGLWLNLRWEARSFPPGSSISLLWESSVLRLEWPVSSGSGPVWRWTGDRADAMGRGLVAGTSLEGWVALDRIPEELWRATSRQSWRLVWAVSSVDGIQTIDLGTLSPEDFP